MTNTISDISYMTQESNPIRSIALISYGLISYTLGVAGLALCILVYTGLIPIGFAANFGLNTPSAIAINMALLILFGLQHSVLARPSTKQFLNRYFSSAIERCNYVWTSGVMLALVVAFWQPIEGVIWETNNSLASYALWAGFLFGWSYLLAATFAINHWDLFGLRQIWLAATNKSYTPVDFKAHWMYRYSRHPIMLGVIIGIWCVPTMSASLLLLSIGLTLYIAIGVYFEERDLIKQWGHHYIEYKKQVGALFTL